MDAEKLLHLLILTWVADGKTVSQVRAFCNRVGLAGWDADVVVAKFELAGTFDPADVRAVMEVNDCGVHAARDALRDMAGDVAAACERVRTKGYASGS
jgi:hypothetical protein